MHYHLPAACLRCLPPVRIMPLLPPPPPPPSPRSASASAAQPSTPPRSPLSLSAHWGYADYDMAIGNVPLFLEREELEQQDIVTYAYGDMDALYLRGQWTWHRNRPEVNQVWQRCAHLASELEKELALKVAALRQNCEWQLASTARAPLNNLSHRRASVLAALACLALSLYRSPRSPRGAWRIVTRPRSADALPVCRGVLLVRGGQGQPARQDCEQAVGWLGGALQPAGALRSWRHLVVQRCEAAPRPLDPSIPRSLDLWVASAVASAALPLPSPLTRRRLANV